MNYRNENLEIEMIIYGQVNNVTGRKIGMKLKMAAFQNGFEFIILL